MESPKKVGAKGKRQFPIKKGTRTTSLDRQFSNQKGYLVEHSSATGLKRPWDKDNSPETQNAKKPDQRRKESEKQMETAKDDSNEIEIIELENDNKEQEKVSNTIEDEEDFVKVTYGKKNNKKSKQITIEHLGIRTPPPIKS